MFKRWISFFCIAVHFSFADSLFEKDQEIVVANKKIYFEDFPEAFNPSMIEYGDGYLLIFRYTPFQRNLFLSYIGIVLLDAQFEPISSPELLLTRHRSSTTQSQSEDARLFRHRDRLFVIYNDNMEMAF